MVLIEISASGQHPVSENLVTRNDSSENFEEYLTNDINAIKHMNSVLSENNKLDDFGNRINKMTVTNQMKVQLKNGDS